MKKCQTCKKGNLVKVGIISEYLCDNCTKCPKCSKELAIIDRTYGVLPGEVCQKIQAAGSTKKTSKSVTAVLEHLATPFWKHAGFKAKPYEKRQEKWMKRKGLSYLDLQKKRVQESKQRFDSTELKRRLHERNLPKPLGVSYRK